MIESFQQTYISNLEKYGKEIQKLNIELKEILKDLENLQTRDEIYVKLSNSINQILCLEKTNFEHNIGIFQLKIKIKDLESKIELENNKSQKINLLEKQEEMTIKFLELNNKLNYHRNKISEYITESKYELIGMLNNIYKN